MAALWLRTLLDLVTSALREQLAAPHSTAGLLEAQPGKPLPWKGVILVLIPGLIFLISQVGQLAGKDWFFLMVYRAAYFLILPVLVVWVWKRRFPIWGLVPLGLLFRTLERLEYRLQFLVENTPNPLLLVLVKWYQRFPNWQRVTTMAVLLLAIACLLWLVRRQLGIPRRAWAWFGVYVLLSGAKITITTLDFYAMNRREYFPVNIFSQPGLGYLLDISFYEIHLYSAFLVAILIGALLARRHGRLAVLLPLGYLLPTVIYGRVSNDWPAPGAQDFTFMLWVSATALAYRFLVAFAGPLWILRSASGQMQKRAGAISLFALVAIQAAFNLRMMFTTQWAESLLKVSFLIISEQLIFGAGLGLALALYREVAEGKAVSVQAKPVTGSAPAG
jgi:hypothetical protein